jgi:hypothetical protein
MISEDSAVLSRDFLEENESIEIRTIDAGMKIVRGPNFRFVHFMESIPKQRERRATGKRV